MFCKQCLSYCNTKTYTIKFKSSVYMHRDHRKHILFYAGKGNAVIELLKLLQ